MRWRAQWPAISCSLIRLMLPATPTTDSLTTMRFCSHGTTSDDSLCWRSVCGKRVCLCWLLTPIMLRSDPFTLDSPRRRFLGNRRLHLRRRRERESRNCCLSASLAAEVAYLSEGTMSLPGKGLPDLAPRTIGVKQVPTEELRANPHNPRMLFDKAPLGVLLASIEKVGILVPLTVYLEAATRKYVILDGQRRWLVAQKLKMSSVPVNEVEEPSLVQNIVTMFQIHKLREDWELMPTALKVEVLMQELGERSEKKLAVLTGLDQAVVSRCKKLLTYHRRYQDMMLHPEPGKRVRADFFIELYAVRNDRWVNALSWFSRNAFTDSMLDRYLERNGIRSVTDFRTLKQLLNNGRRANQEEEIARRFNEFVHDPSLTMEHLAIRAADVSARARKIESAVSSLSASIKGIDVDEFYGEEDLWELLEELRSVIEQKLRHADRRTVNAAT